MFRYCRIPGEVEMETGVSFAFKEMWWNDILQFEEEGRNHCVFEVAGDIPRCSKCTCGAGVGYLQADLISAQ
jgi:hypothetical protein